MECWWPDPVSKAGGPTPDPPPCPDAGERSEEQPDSRTPNSRAAITGGFNWSFDADRAVTHLARIMVKRDAVVEANPEILTIKIFLPKRFQLAIQKELFCEWVEGEGRGQVGDVHSCGYPKAKSDRTIKSYYRTHQKEVFGGAVWANSMVAIEQIDEDLVNLVNRFTREKHEILKEKQQEGPTPKQLPRADRPDKTIQGVHHTESDGKKLRAKGRER